MKASQKINSDVRIVHDTSRNLLLINVGEFFTKDEYLELIHNLRETDIGYFIKRNKL